MHDIGRKLRSIEGESSTRTWISSSISPSLLIDTMRFANYCIETPRDFITEYFEKRTVKFL